MGPSSLDPLRASDGRLLIGAIIEKESFDDHVDMMWLTMGTLHVAIWEIYKRAIRASNEWKCVVHFLCNRGSCELREYLLIHVEKSTALVSCDIARTFVNETLPSMLEIYYNKALA